MFKGDWPDAKGETWELEPCQLFAHSKHLAGKRCIVVTFGQNIKENKRNLITVVFLLFILINAKFINLIIYKVFY
jgi:hypothetical protein